MSLLNIVVETWQYYERICMNAVKPSEYAMCKDNLFMVEMSHSPRVEQDES